MPVSICFLPPKHEAYKKQPVIWISIFLSTLVMITAIVNESIASCHSWASFCESVNAWLSSKGHRTTWQHLQWSLARARIIPLSRLHAHEFDRVTIMKGKCNYWVLRNCHMSHSQCVLRNIGTILKGMASKVENNTLHIETTPYIMRCSDSTVETMLSISRSIHVNFQGII